MSKETILLTSPSHDGRIDMGSARSLYGTAAQKRPFLVLSQGGSLLTNNCNTLWCAALNNYESENIRWFAMLHSDIDADPFWLDAMIDEAESVGADMLSAVIPIKDKRGLTSTAIEDPDDPWCPWCRLTTTQVMHESFPKTFDAWSAIKALEALPDGLRVECPEDARLLVNTGCFVCRVKPEWATRGQSPKVWFDDRNRIEWKGDCWQPVVQPEDWYFSRKVAEAGGTVMATTKVRVVHKGAFGYDSKTMWGNSVDDDCLNRRLVSVNGGA